MSEPPRHYFSGEPQGPEHRRTIEVDLAGRRVPVQTAAGIFCPDRLDLGTSVLLREAPDPPPTGRFLDLGCGWGPIALTLGLLAPEAEVWGVDVNQRALGLARDNAASLGLKRVHAVTATEVPSDVGFDLIWSNPPIRVGKQVLHELLLTWLPRLEPGGEAYLVVQRNLGADSLQTWLTGVLPDALGPGATVERYASAKGFRVLRVVRPLAPDADPA